ncbi:DnaJ domain containing protein [Sesbania bispinosa]|nr:DnaJ domain containing protein [Sesbania bispinosa]
MVFNKDEAIRAREIAENKFAAKDILGAMEFALRAQRLFPYLEGISQMITTFHVYICATNEINGEVDWYGILGVDPLADDDTMRKQYRKMTHVLHPDNNKSVGADGAFKLISDAWSLLSDEAKRVAYDEKINAKSAQTGADGSYSFTETTASNARTQGKTADGMKVVKDEEMVNNEDTMIKETTDNMKEADGEEMNKDMGASGEEKKEIETMEEGKKW